MHKVINGIDCISDVVKDFSSKKLLLVAGSSFHSLGVSEKIKSLEVDMVFFSAFTPNPLFEQVVAGVELFKNEECDAILAVGGGSAIDVAKCIKLAVVSCEGVDALIPPLVSTKVEIPESSVLPLIAIPTTAGTGSESTHNAVMYYDDSKQTVVNDAILPDVAILEPSVLKNLPLYQKKCTMMDALCQGIESWWSVNSTDESREYSKKAVELIMDNWETYIFNNDYKAAEQIMLAANYSGKAINIAQTTAAHAMSYKITSLFKLPHGHAVALCLPVIWEYMINNLDKCCDARGAKYVEMIFEKIALTMMTCSVKSAIITYRFMMDKLELSSSDINISENQLNILASSVNPVRLKNNPISLNENEVRRLYSYVIHSNLQLCCGL